MDSGNSTWPFAAPENEASFVSAAVLQGARIAHVYHDWDDGAWQFLPDTETAPEDCRIVCLSHVYQLDPSIGELADLPEGWRAERGPDGVWHRSLNHPYPTFATHGYELVTVALFPEHYPGVPAAEELTSLPAGRLVKLVFWFAPEQSTGVRPDCTVERMWVIVTGFDEETGAYHGTLDNVPMFNTGIAEGDGVVFHAQHVLALM